MRRMRLDRNRQQAVKLYTHLHIARYLVVAIPELLLLYRVCKLVVDSLTLSIAPSLLTFAILLCISIRKRLHSAQLADNFFI